MNTNIKQNGGLAVPWCLAVVAAISAIAMFAILAKITAAEPDLDPLYATVVPALAVMVSSQGGLLLLPLLFLVARHRMAFKSPAGQTVCFGVFAMIFLVGSIIGSILLWLSIGST